MVTCVFSLLHVTFVLTVPSAPQWPFVTGITATEVLQTLSEYASNSTPCTKTVPHVGASAPVISNFAVVAVMPVQVVLVDFWNWNLPPVKGKKTNGEGEIKVKNNNQTKFWKIKKKRTVAFNQYALCRVIWIYLFWDFFRAVTGG